MSSDSYMTGQVSIEDQYREARFNLEAAEINLDSILDMFEYNGSSGYIEDSVVKTRDAVIEMIKVRRLQRIVNNLRKQLNGLHKAVERVSENDEN